MGIAEKYLLVVGVVGFLMYLLNMFLYAHTATGNVDMILTIISFAGGSWGIVVAILLFERKSVKENMMSRVFVICMFIIQLVIYLFFKGAHGQQITLAFWDFFAKHKILIIYLLTINFVAFTVYALDKMRAIEHKWRFKIVTLLGLAFAGGSLGAILSMYIFRHKTSVDYFTIGVPLIMVMQAVVFFYLMNM